MSTRAWRSLRLTGGAALLLTAALLAGVPAAEAAGSGCQFPATGQTTCWDSSGTVILCPGTGQDGDIHAKRPLHYVDHGNGTITDTITGLIWEKLDKADGIHDVGNTYTWDDAFAVHVEGLNDASFAGHTDWRLPDVKELQSLVDYETFTRSVDPAFNTGCTDSCTVLTCSCTAASLYWSSSTGASIPAGAWFVVFNSGDVGSVTPSASVPCGVAACD